MAGLRTLPRRTQSLNEEGVWRSFDPATAPDDWETRPLERTTWAEVESYAADPNRLLLISRAHRPLVHAFFYALELWYYEPGTPANAEYQNWLAVWQEVPWNIISIHKRHGEKLRRATEQFDLTLKESYVLRSFDGWRWQDYPVGGAAQQYVVENAPDSPIYRLVRNTTNEVKLKVYERLVSLLISLGRLGPRDPLPTFAEVGGWVSATADEYSEDVIACWAEAADNPEAEERLLRLVGRVLAHAAAAAG